MGMSRLGSVGKIANLETHPALAETASKLFYWAATEKDPAGYLNLALPMVAQTLGGDYVALAKGEKGIWRTIASSGPQRPLPTDLLSETLDSDAPVSRRDWCIAPLALHGGNGELFAAYRTWAGAADRGGTLEALLGYLHSGLEAVRARQRELCRNQRLQAILEIAARWQQTLQMGPLLAQIAETSTRLLGAERASIFLWDKPNKTLVGRPALGVPSGELRIPDDAGVVGQVVQTGQPRRVDADVETEQREVDRRVDKQLKYETRSIVCGPLRGKSGQLFGAFEVLNRIGGNFSDDDEEALTELAAHAGVALENTQQFEKLVHARKQVADEAAQGVQLIGNCPAVEALRSTIRRVADT